MGWLAIFPYLLTGASSAPLSGERLAALLAVLAVLATLLPLTRHAAWWVRGLDFLRIQVTVSSAVVLFAYLMLVGAPAPHDLVLLGALAACILFQAKRLAPYTPLHGKRVDAALDPRAEDELTVLVINVLQSNRDARALLRVIREHQPDIVLAVETDGWWEEQLQVLRGAYPHTVGRPLDNLYGMLLFSRLELVEPQVLELVEESVPSIHSSVILRSGHRVALHGLHPAPPSPTENPTSLERDAELLAIAKKIDGRSNSVVVMGDLNDVPWSPTLRAFQRSSGLLDPRIGRGVFNTFHAGYPFLRWPLDHVFVSTDFTLVSFERLPSIGSDHFPVLAALCHTPAAQRWQEAPRAESEDKKLVESRIEAAAPNEAGLRAATDPPES